MKTVRWYPNIVKTPSKNNITASGIIPYVSKYLLPVDSITGTHTIEANKSQIPIKMVPAAGDMNISSSAFKFAKMEFE